MAQFNRVSFICTFVIFATNLFAFADVDAPYHPHPRNQSQNRVQNNYAVLLASDALHRIAMAHDSAIPGVQIQIRTQLLDLQNIETLLGYFPIASTTHRQDQTLRSGLATWLNSYPLLHGHISGGHTPSTDDVLLLAIELSKLANRLQPRPAPRTVRQSLETLSYGPFSPDQPVIFRDLYNTALSFCRGENINLAQLRLPSEFETALSIVQNTRFLLPLIERFLGNNKSCRTLARDLFEIVTPHHSAIGSNREFKGQVEGLSVFLTKNYLGRIQRLLGKLSHVQSLGTERSEYEAVRAVLHREHPTPRETLLLIGLATHNHSVELYIQKILLDLNTNEQVSIRAAQDSLAGINHLYRLLQEFRVKKQIAERRYYHYWGGALVACEMRTRGYNDWVVRLVGKILGTVYEEWSGSFSEIQGESFSGSSEDISLHDRGAAWGSALCSHNP